MGRTPPIALMLCACLWMSSCLPEWPPPGLDDDTSAGDDDTSGDDDSAGDDDTASPPTDWVSMTGDDFDMGSEGGPANEQPLRKVTVEDFEIWRTEVTVEQYEACVDAAACAESTVVSETCNWDVVGYEHYPANCLGWDHAVVFCEWVGGRLPSEAEWEFAARGGGLVVVYPWGDEPADCDRAVMEDPALGGNGCGEGRTLEVCSRSPDGDSEQGLCDMAGNVWEWVQDTWHDDYDGAPVDGSAWELDGDDNRVTRGGSQGNQGEKLTTTYRDFGEPEWAIGGLGFRCARSN
jgi:formylglycine-generating enzyme required for sulfatase activity